MPRIVIALIFLLPCASVLAAELVRPRPLMEYTDILLAQELDIAVGTLNDSLAHCIDSGIGSASECYCRHPLEAEATKAIYVKILQARPKWKGKVLFWKNPETLASRNLVMPAIDNMLQSPDQECGSTHQSEDKP